MTTFTQSNIPIPTIAAAKTIDTFSNPDTILVPARPGEYAQGMLIVNLATASSYLREGSTVIYAGPQTILVSLSGTSHNQTIDALGAVVASSAVTYFK